MSMRKPISPEISPKELRKYLRIQVLKQAFDLLNDHVVITDENSNILYANQAVKRQTGYDPGEIFGKNPGDLWGGHMPKEMYKKMWHTIKVEKKAYVGEVKNIRKDGVEYWQEVHIVPVLDKSGDIQFFIGLEPSVTAKKEEEEFQKRLLPVFQELAKTIVVSENVASALKEYVKTICQFTDWAVGEIWIPSRNGSVLENVYMWAGEKEKQLEPFISATKNFTFAPQSGLPGRVWVTKKTEWIQNVSEEPVASFLRVKTAKIAGLKAAVGFPVIIKDKVVAVLTFFIFTEREKDEDFVEFISSILHELELFLEHKDKEKFRQAFLSTISHQLRNPLMAISWALQLLFNRKNLTQEQQAVLSDAYQKSEVLAELVKSLLVLAGSEKGELSIRETDLSEEIAHIVKEVQLQRPEVAIHLLAPKTAPLFTIPVLADQVFANLIYNAAEYASSKHGIVDVALKRTDGAYYFSCYNNGSHIAPKDQKKIFVRPFRGAEAQEKGSSGAGLGLSIVKMIVDMLGWKASFKNEERGGVTFFVDIPAEG